MYVLRRIDAYCASCQDVLAHTVVADDLGCCTCTRCGTMQVLMVPMDGPVASFGLKDPVPG